MWHRRLAIFALSLILSVGIGGLSFAADPPAGSPTRGVNVQEVWRQVYKQLPDLPLENQYVARESGKADPNNTLVTRLIRYHAYTAGRAPNYRLDWKLTLADYLGLNNIMDAAAYPGADTLRQNPMERDRTIIQKLNRKQRDTLVQVLVSAFTPAASNPVPQPSSTAPAKPRSSGSASDLIKR